MSRSSCRAGPVGIFALTDRGDVFTDAALTMLLVASTLAVLLVLARIPTKAAQRCPPEPLRP